MKSFDYTITDEIGIHARPAGILAKRQRSTHPELPLPRAEKLRKHRSLWQL